MRENERYYIFAAAETEKYSSQSGDRHKRT